MSRVLNCWYNSLLENKVVANNKVKGGGVSLCLNFLQIPDTQTVVITVSIVENNKKKIALSPQNFFKIMNLLESSLSECAVEYQDSTATEDEKEEYFINLTNFLGDKWYNTLKCHRVFLIPESALFIVINRIFSLDNINEIKQYDVDRVLAKISTENYKFVVKS